MIPQLKGNLKKYLILFVVVCIGAITIRIIMPSIFFNIGKKQYENKKYDKAYKSFGVAKGLSPKNEDYEYSYVLALAHIKPTMSVQREMFAISEQKNENKATRLAKSQVLKWRGKIMSSYGNNYIEQAPQDNEIIRWNPETFPLKVCIDYPIEDQMPEYYRTEITKAFFQWQNSTGFMKFTFVEHPKDADIVVKFSELPENNCSEQGCKYVVAYTLPTIKKHILKQMSINLYNKDAYGNFFSDKELYNTILHEIGHALGIMGHSYSTDDLMYMTNEDAKNSIFMRYRSDFQYISPKDSNTIRLLYNIEPTITNTPIKELKTDGLIYAPVVLGAEEEISKRKIKEAENYIKKAPNLPNGYVDLAIAYAGMGDTKKASINFNKALQLVHSDYEKYEIYYNYAVTFLNNNKPKEALKHAQMAQSLQNTDDVKELIGVIEHSISTKKNLFSGSFLGE